MTQRLIYTMGPSGAGKDSLLAWLKDRVPVGAPVHWAQRTITRPVQVGGEQHEVATVPDFIDLRAQAAFALDWEANGLFYGVRHAELAPIDHGNWVLVNGSRAYLPQAIAQYRSLTVLHVTASADTLRQRLLARGREGLDKVEARVQRATAFQSIFPVNTIEIHNDGRLDAAGAQLLQALRLLDGWVV